MPLIPALERQRQTDLCEINATLVCGGSRTPGLHSPEDRGGEREQERDKAGEESAKQSKLLFDVFSWCLFYWGNTMTSTYRKKKHLIGSLMSFRGLDHNDLSGEHSNTWASRYGTVEQQVRAYILICR